MNARLRGFAAFHAVALASAAVLLAHADGAAYLVTDLGNTYHIDGSSGRILNDQGQVIGNEISDNGQPYLYTNGSWAPLGHLNTSGSGNTSTLALGLNNAGLVVGQSDTGRSGTILDQTDGFFINGPDPITALGLVSAANNSQLAAAYGCNDLGIIVGNVFAFPAGARETFLFIPNTGVVSRTSDGIYSFAINRFGDVLGTAGEVLRQAMLNGVALPALTAGLTPHAINNSGQILLSCDNTHPLSAGWGLIYNYGTGKATPLGNLSPQSGGYTTFLDINDLGYVVGRGSDENLNPHAVLYTPGAGLTSLDSLGLTIGADPVHLIEADGINNAGQIVCLGYTTDPNDIHGYLLTPDTMPVLPLAAMYDGLAGMNGANIGVAAIAVSKTNVASVKLRAPGVSYAFKVTLTNGSFTGLITVKDVTLNVSLNADAAHRKISGSIADPNVSYTVSALRQAKLGVFAGNYTALLQISGPPNGLPQGIGYGTMKVSKIGAVKIKGQLGDGSGYSVAAKFHYDGSWTFYAPLYSKTQPPGAIAGSMVFNRAAIDSDCAGALKWNKPGDFTADVTCKAAFFKPVKNAQVLRFADAMNGTATFAFSGGEQSLALKTLAVTDKNIVTVTAPNPDADALAVKLSASAGSMSGSFTHPATGKKTPFVGVIQQKLNLGGGVFQGQATEGGVLLTPQ